MPKTPSAKSASKALASLNRLGRTVSKTAVARETNIPRSTLYSWGKRGLPKAARERVIEAARVAEKELTLSKKEIDALKSQVKDIYTLRQQGFVAKASGRRVATLDEWREEFDNNPTVKNAIRLRDAIKSAEGQSKKIRDGMTYTKVPRTGEMIPLRRTEDWEGMPPPIGNAEAIRIFGVDKDGEIIISTTYADEYDLALGDFDAQASKDEYDSQVVGAIVQLSFEP